MLVFVIEDDKRGEEVSKLFLKQGYYVSDNLKDLKYAHLIYLGLKGIDHQNRIQHRNDTFIIEEDYFKSLNEQCLVYTIVENKYLRTLANKYNFSYISLLSNSEFVSFNTEMTTEGLISYMIDKIDVPLTYSRILILGYGKCAKSIAKYLKCFTDQIVVGVRNEDLKKQIEEKGYQYMSLDKLELNGFNMIINTIPCPVICKGELDILNKNTFLFDIASFPYGIDHHEAIKRGFHSYIIPSIPAKYFSKYSANCIVNIMKKKGEIICLN